MARFHINQKTGKTGRCKAQHSCPFGDLQKDHYDNEKDARKAYEASMASKTFTPRRKRKLLVPASVVVVATFSLTGCKTPDISLPSDTPTPTVTAPATPQTPTSTPKGETPQHPSSSTPQTPTASSKAQELTQKLSTLQVKGRAPMTGYSRDAFMSTSDWNKARQATLNRDLTNINYNSRGDVKTGTLVKDPYTGKTINYVRGGDYENGIDIDHVVSLGNAYASGIQYKDAGTRLALATDPLNLQSTDPSSNRQKGDGDAATWLPPNKEYRCEYVGRQIKVKVKYTLSVTSAEKAAMTNVISKNC